MYLFFSKGYYRVHTWTRTASCMQVSVNSAWPVWPLWPCCWPCIHDTVDCDLLYDGTCIARCLVYYIILWYICLVYVCMLVMQASNDAHISNVFSHMHTRSCTCMLQIHWEKQTGSVTKHSDTGRYTPAWHVICLYIFAHKHCNVHAQNTHKHILHTKYQAYIYPSTLLNYVCVHTHIHTHYYHSIASVDKGFPILQ